MELSSAIRGLIGLAFVTSLAFVFSSNREPSIGGLFLQASSCNSPLHSWL